MAPLHESLARLFGELIDGPRPEAAFMLNSGDKGLLRSLESLTGADASRVPANGGAPIVAHVDHVCYGLELMNSWSAGNPDPWSNADWTASWRRRTVSDEEWVALRARLRDTARRWYQALETPRQMTAIEMDTVIGSIAHLAYHLGSIRQIDRSIRGPQADA
jgi:hypothetical protein